ncbi:MAG TPA: RDD family protein [Cytophagaceae bacterium]|nr:RDD family protein [Cytophagaceae bacterium]
MEKIRIETAHNIVIEHDIASVADRIASNLLDYLIISVYYFIIWVLMFSLAIGGFHSIQWILLFVSIPPIFYQLVCEIFLEGQSFGMRAVRTKVIRMDGTQPGIGSYLLRWLLRPIDIFTSYGGVAVITILINGKGQRLGDIAAGTTVIKMKKAVKLSDTILAQTHETHVPVFPQVEKLTDREIGIIVETLSVFKYQGKIMPVQVVAKKIKEVLKIETTMKPWDFLKTVVKDYNHLTGKVNEN